MPQFRQRAPLAILVLLLATLAACSSTEPGTAEVGGNWVAVTVNGDSLPVPSRGCGLSGCTELVDMQLRFRTRGRLLDVRRFHFQPFEGDPAGAEEIGGAYAYRLFGDDSILLVRPVADTAYADSGVFVGDTLLMHVRKLEPQFGGVGEGRGPLVRFVRTPAEAP